MLILFADDHPLFREGVKPVLYKLAEQVEIVEAKDYPSLFAMADRYRQIDLAIVDLYMPGMAGLSGVNNFRAAYPNTPLVVISAAEGQEDIQQLLANGALGYISKSSPSDVIFSALQLVLAGGMYVPPSALAQREGEEMVMFTLDSGRHASLTRRQVQVLRELAKGQSNKQIARSLDVTEGTIKIHLSTIFRLLNVANRTEAVLLAQKMGFGSFM